MNAAREHRAPVTDAPPQGLPAVNPRAVMAILDKLHRGVILVDHHVRPLFMNSAASTMLLRSDALCLANGRILLRERHAQARLERYFQATTGNGGQAPETLVMRLERGGDPAYRLLLMPIELPGEVPTEVSTVHAIFIYEPHSGRFIPTRVLTELYELTPAEARLTAELFRGASLEGAASRLGIASSTARSHLKQVFAKCEVQSQAELLQLLALGPRTC